MRGSAFEEIDHTADTGLRITAPNLRELFITGARGMFTLIMPEPDSRAEDAVRHGKKEERRVSLSSADRETLLRDWLAELLYLHTTDRLYFTDFTLDTVRETRLQGTARGIPLSEDFIHSLMDIKAVTYHGLEIRETDEGFVAQVIFDI